LIRFKKQPNPRDVTEFGIIIESKDFYFPIEATESGMLIELRERHD
jgi:hypothetical protein